MDHFRQRRRAQHRAQRPDGFCLAVNARALGAPIVLDAQLSERLLDHPTPLLGVRPFHQQHDIGNAPAQSADGDFLLAAHEALLHQVIARVLRTQQKTFRQS